jgi:transposase
MVLKAAGKDPRHTRVKIAARFCRIAFQMLAGRQVFHHPGCQNCDRILQKLIEFHRQHESPMEAVLADLNAAAEQIPHAEYGQEAAPLAAQLEQLQARRRRGRVPLVAEILPAVPSAPGGRRDTIHDVRATRSPLSDQVHGPRTSIVPKAQSLD